MVDIHYLQGRVVLLRDAHRSVTAPLPTKAYCHKGERQNEAYNNCISLTVHPSGYTRNITIELPIKIKIYPARPEIPLGAVEVEIQFML